MTDLKTLLDEKLSTVFWYMDILDHIKNGGSFEDILKKYEYETYLELLEDYNEAQEQYKSILKVFTSEDLKNISKKLAE